MKWVRGLDNKTRCMPSLTVYPEPLTRYVTLWVAHAPGMPGTFSPPPTSKETVN